jgi:lipopolysaccharide export system permease protein
MLRILQRYILKEFLSAFLAAVVLLVGLLLVGMVVRKLRSGLDLFILVRLVPYLVLFTVQYVLAMATVCGGALAFGRLAADNEVMVVRSSGIHLAHIVAPVLIVGAICCPISLALNDRVVPAATHQLRGTLLDLMKTADVRRILLLLMSNEIELPRVSLRVGNMRRNKLKDVVIYWEDDRAGFVRWAAREATVDFRKDNLVFTMTRGMLTRWDPKKTDESMVNSLFSRHVEPVPLQSIVDRTRRKRRNEKTTPELMEDLYEQMARYENSRARLIYWTQRLEKLVTQPVAPRADPEDERAVEEAERQEERELKRLKRRMREVAFWTKEVLEWEEPRGGRRSERKLRAEIQRRWALSLAPIVFLLVGIPLGIMRRGANKIVGLGISAIPVIIVYYPTFIFGEGLAVDGTLPAWIAMWMANGITALGGGVLMWRLLRK